MKKKLFAGLGKYWQLYGFGTLAVIAFAVLYAFHLGQPSTLSPLESQAVTSSQSVGAIAQNPLNLPHKVLGFAWQHAPLSDVVTARLASVSIALVRGFLFYVLVRRWHGNPVAIFMAVLFGTSGWMLHLGRFGGAQILFVLLPLCLLLLGSWLKATRRHNLVVISTALLFGGALFVPGAVWFLLLFAVASGKALRIHFSKASGVAMTNAVIFFLLCIAALALAIYRDTSLLKLWVGLPEVMPSVISMLKQWAGSVTYLVARGPYMPEIWLAHTPVLDVVSTVLLAFGGIFYLRRIKNARALTLLLFFLLGSGMVAVNGAVALGLVVVPAYLVATTGLAYFIHQWSNIFPRNPLAYGLAITLVGAMVLAAANFHTQRYFIAWQRSPATIDAYSQNHTP